MEDRVEIYDNIVADLLLPKRRLIVVKNMQAAQDRLRKWIASCPGRKMRQVQFDHDKLEISDYKGDVVQSALLQLKQANLFIKQIPWKLHPALRSTE